MSDLSKYREALTEAIRAAGVEIGSTGGQTFRSHVADRLLASDVLAQMLADARAEALREFARKWAEWVAACAPQIRGGAAYRAICEAQEIESAEASGREGER